MITNELGRCPTRSDNVCLAYNEQVSLAALFENAKHNLIKLKFYNNWSAQAINNISESALWYSSKPIKFSHLWKLANQWTLNKSHVIETTKACTVAFMKAINSLVIRCREERINWRKKQKMVKIYFKASANRFWLTWKSCSWFSKVDNGRSSAKWTSWKGNDMLLKVDDIYSLLRKSHWK